MSVLTKVSTALMISFCGSTAVWAGDGSTRPLDPFCETMAVKVPDGSLSVRDFGARGDGIHDDSLAIGAALIAVKPGGTIFFPPGTYAHARVIKISNSDLTLMGQDAALLATNPDQSAIVLVGNNITLSGLIVTSAPSSSRGTSDDHSGLVVKGVGNRVIGNVISDTKSTGIWISGGKNYEIACNRVFNTKSDGIHSTDGASQGLVRYNNVFNSGDDGIAVVSYNLAQRASQIVVENNSVEHIRWGRGLSVIGSTDVTIRRNRVSLIAMAAGIIVAREASFGTPGAGNVVIEDNVIGDIQQNIQPLGFGRRTGHGAIEINSDDDTPALAIDGVTIGRNVIDGSAYDGIRLLGNVCDVAIDGNQMTGVRGDPISVHSRCPNPIERCANNSSGGLSAPCSE